MFFSLHSFADREWLLREWALSFNPRELWGPATAPLLEIRDYFGEKIALYFAWLEFYTKMLVLPLLAGLPLFFVEKEGYSLVAFGGFTGLWSTLLMSFWERKNRLLNMWWGTPEGRGFASAEGARHQFIGVTRRGPITDRVEIWHVSSNQVRNKMFVSFAVIILLLGACVGAVSSVFALKYHMTYVLRLKWAAYYAGVINAVQIGVLNIVYQKVAQRLTNWENHRSDNSYESALVIKTFIFQFVNSYASFFYIAFFKEIFEAAAYPSAICTEDYYKTELLKVANTTAFTPPQQRYWDIVQHTTHQCGGCLLNNNGVPDCMFELQLSLGSTFVARLVIGNIIEIFIPYFWARYRHFHESRNIKAINKAECGKDKTQYSDLESGGGGSGAEASVRAVAGMVTDATVTMLDAATDGLRDAGTATAAMLGSTADVLSPAEEEAKLSKYEEIESFNDYSEMIIQYGFVTLFVVAFPLAPLLAFVNNVAEMHVDAYKLLQHHRRPFPKTAGSIGTWAVFMEFMSTVSVVSNTCVACRAASPCVLCPCRLLAVCCFASSGVSSSTQAQCSHSQTTPT